MKLSRDQIRELIALDFWNWILPAVKKYGPSVAKWARKK
jgi:hypothetical protein